MTLPALNSATLDAPDQRSVMKPVLILLGIAACIRIGMLVLLVIALKGRDLNDDFPWYQMMIENPLMLITGYGAERMGIAGIYAPLVPIQLLIPGKLFIALFGLQIGHRCAMIVYDLAAVGIALMLAFRILGTPQNRVQWIGALLLIVLPTSIGASAVWGQEESVMALWAAISLWAFIAMGPVAAMCVAGFGLFTSKTFVVVLMFGLWLATPRSRRLVTAITGAAWVGAFALFVYIRYRISGYYFPEITHHIIINSASPWTAWYLLVGPLDYMQIRYALFGITSAAMLGLAACFWRRGLPVWNTVIAAHAVFFLTFLGLHPEHYQWFAPFLIVYSWMLVKDRRWFAFATAWAVSGFAYAYKVIYGLHFRQTESTGKQFFRDYYERYFHLDLGTLRTVFLFLTLGSLLLLLWQTMRQPAPKA